MYKCITRIYIMLLVIFFFKFYSIQICRGIFVHLYLITVWKLKTELYFVRMIEIKNLETGKHVKVIGYI